jgi:anti-anti-sigma factor
MSTPDEQISPYFHVYKQGTLSVIGFDGRHLANPDNAPYVQESLLSLVNRSVCQILAVDLMEVSIVSSWVLGILAAVHKSGINVQLYHPNSALQDVLETTRLDSMLHVRDGLTKPVAANIPS